uniref:Adhesion G protein-coupled receptor F3b n=1 Tax=Gouania willdenowi TaxID=441366 RepID=A0A8C5DII9_GOUWI
TVMAINNLMPKLSNTFLNTNYTNVLVSATLDRYHGGNNSHADIWLDFPVQDPSKPYCVFWNITTREWSDFGCVVVNRDENRTECACNHLTSFSVLMSKGDVSTKELDVLTNVGLAVSLCSLVLLLLIEYVVWAAVVRSNLSHFRHTAIVNISTFRLLADICFLASIFPKSLSDNWCLTLTLAKHLFYLAMFCWMMCLSIMLVHQLIFVFSPLRKRVFMFLSSIVGYLFPIIIVGSSYVYCKYKYKPYYDSDTCWLVFERLLEGSLHAFLIPVAVVILVNVFSLVVVIVTLVKTSVPDSGKAAENETAKGIIKVIVLLAPLFGVTWIIGFFLLILDHNNPVFPVANYAFTILNSFQVKSKPLTLKFPLCNLRVAGLNLQRGH